MEISVKCRFLGNCAQTRVGVERERDRDRGEGGEGGGVISDARTAPGGKEKFFKSFRRFTENHSSPGQAVEDNKGLGSTLSGSFLNENPSLILELLFLFYANSIQDVFLLKT